MTLPEASMNFDAELIGAFLEQLSVLAVGFGPSQLAEVIRVVDELEVDEERELPFEVMHEGQPMPLNIRIFKDDVDASNLYFFAPPRLIEKIEKLMDSFCEAHGI